MLFIFLMEDLGYRFSPTRSQFKYEGFTFQLTIKQSLPLS